MNKADLARPGYAHYYDMLADSIRMDAYRKAIYKTIKPGDIVVDLGAGTGILGLWAIQAGASKVYAIEKTDAIHLSIEIARANKCFDKFVFLNQNSTHINLPEKADVLISETLGSFAIDENTLQFTIDARDRFLKPGGKMIPEDIDLYIAPVDDAKAYNKIDIWRQIPDLDFSPAFDLFSRKIMIETIKASSLLAQVSHIGHIDLYTHTSVNYQGRVYSRMNKAGTIHGIAGWFKTRLCDEIYLTNAPNQAATHWKQVLFPLREPIAVIEGDILDWSINVEAAGKDSDDTSISYNYRCTQIKNEQQNATARHPPGRNSDCSCGSGLKYKKCCMS